MTDFERTTTFNNQEQFKSYQSSGKRQEVIPIHKIGKPIDTGDSNRSILYTIPPLTSCKMHGKKTPHSGSKLSRSSTRP